MITTNKKTASNMTTRINYARFKEISATVAVCAGVIALFLFFLCFMQSVELSALDSDAQQIYRVVKDHELRNFTMSVSKLLIPITYISFGLSLYFNHLAKRVAVMVTSSEI